MVKSCTSTNIYIWTRNQLHPLFWHYITVIPTDVHSGLEIKDRVLDMPRSPPDAAGGRTYFLFEAKATIRDLWARYGHMLSTDHSLLVCDFLPREMCVIGLLVSCSPFRSALAKLRQKPGPRNKVLHCWSHFNCKPPHKPNAALPLLNSRLAVHPFTKLFERHSPSACTRQNPQSCFGLFTGLEPRSEPLKLGERSQSPLKIMRSLVGNSVETFGCACHTRFGSHH